MSSKTRTPKESSEALFLLDTEKTQKFREKTRPKPQKTFEIELATRKLFQLFYY